LTAFHREFSQIALKRGWLRLYLLRLDGKPASFLYGFHYGRKFYFYQSSFDAAYAKHSPGLIMMGLAIRSAIEEGRRVRLAAWRRKLQVALESRQARSRQIGTVSAESDGPDLSLRDWAWRALLALSPAA
jgi:hypothetical protein